MLYRPLGPANRVIVPALPCLRPQAATGDDMYLLVQVCFQGKELLRMEKTTQACNHT